MSRNLEQGVQAIQGGMLEEGARLLRIALKEDQLAANLRAVALLWLAETQPDPKFKIECYRLASEADPSNQDVSQRLSYWLSQQLPTQQEPINPGYTQEHATPPQQAAQSSPPVQDTTGSMPAVSPQQYSADATGNMRSVASPRPNTTPEAGGQYGVNPPIYLEDVQRSVGILDGPNGRGTGIFVTREGLIATTRYITGGEEQLQIELMDGRIIPGQVVRSFPDLDISLIQVHVQLSRLLGILRGEFPDNARFTAVPHAANGLSSAKRATRHQTAPHWFPTMINHLNDAGGNPVFNEENLLVGILTKNASRSNHYMYGFYIMKIYQCVEIYLQEKSQVAGNTIYCRACGQISRAPAFKGHYCESCGTTLPHAIDQARFPQPDLAELYGETAQRACPNCTAKVGFHNGSCLRCGHEL